jgi:nucleolin
VQANDDRKLFVGNLAWAVDGLDLEDIFKEFGVVESAQVINDRETGRSRGFGFVIMATKEESAAAASELSGANIDGRKIIVEFASEKAKEER